MLENDTPFKRKIDVLAYFFIVSFFVVIFAMVTSILVCQFTIPHGYFIFGTPPDILYMLIDLPCSIFGLIWLFIRYARVWEPKVVALKIPLHYKIIGGVLFLAFIVTLRILVITRTSGH